MSDSPEFNYTGTDNLEVMAEAINYNAYLSALVAKHIKDAPHVVDFGAGIGTFARQFCTAGRTLIAVEPDQHQAHTIEAFGAPCVADISLIETAWADAIYSVNVLEHIEDDRSILRALHDKLKPGGRLLIYVPAFQLLYSAMDRKVGHFRRYSRAELREKVAAAGFHIHNDGYVDSLGFLASLLYKWRGNPAGDIDRRALRLYDRFAFPVSRVLDRLTSRFIGKNAFIVATK